MIGDDDVRALMSDFDGWTLVSTDVSPPPQSMTVMHLRSPDGAVDRHVAWCGAFGLSTVTAWELKPGHRELVRIYNAKRARAERERAARQADRRLILSASPDPDDCSPFGIQRPPLEAIR